jgi:asparagine synthase (glutamine-hydrolysing)
MCGIAGFFARTPVDDALTRLRRMTASLVHRGPDEEGLRVDGPVALGMRRLSIIDLKSGQQPVANEDGSVWVVFNGEIYNYRELTAELLAKGHRFSTASDTEVLVHLYEEHGDRLTERLRGMFAFALWDAPRRRLLLARDRLGIKPLYYAATGSGVAFGSELKALLASGWVSREVDPRAVRAYLTYGYVPDPLAILAGATKLPPGHTVTVEDGRPGTPREYWQPTTAFRDRLRLSDAEAAAGLESRLISAVQSHLVSDVPVGAFLSGGLDSSTVLALMARGLGAPVKTFSVGFQEEGYNELPYARRVADLFSSEHHELMVAPGDVALLEDVLAAVDEPFADPSSIPTFLISRLAGSHLKVVLSGDGGDEIFAGYDRYVVDDRRRRLGRLGDWGLGGPLRLVSAALPEGTPGKNYLYHLSLPRIERYLDSISLFPARVLPDLVTADVAVATSTSVFETGLAATRGLDPLSRLQDLDLRTYLSGDILTKVDRMSMANSLEARVPLLDHPLVEFACALPPSQRMRSGQTKYLLRRVVKSWLPPDILARPKQGFAVPLTSWFGDRLPGFFRDQLGGGERLAGIGVRTDAVQRLLGHFERGHRGDHCLRLWALVVLDHAIARLSR